MNDNPEQPTKADLPQETNAASQKFNETLKQKERKKKLSCVNCFNEIIVPSFPLSLLALNQESKAVSVSKGFCEMFNIPFQEIIGRTINEIFEKVGLPEKHRKKITSEKIVQNFLCECSFQEKKKRIFNINLTDIRLTEEQEEQRLLLIEDITGHKEIEEGLKIKTEQLTAVSNAMTFFLESGNWRESSAMILRCALSQSESKYGFIGVVTEGPVLRILSHEGIVWDKVINYEFYENALRTYQEIGYIEFTNLDNLIGNTITSGKAIISNDPISDPRSGGRLPRGHPPLYHFLGVPILRGAEVVGIIGVANRPGGYSGAEQSKIEVLSRAAGVLYDSYRRHENQIALEKEHKEAEGIIQRLAYCDLLTGLPNRTTLCDHLQQAIQTAKLENRPLALLIMDLNHFKEINNTLGHHYGNLLLQQVGQRLQGAIGDIVTIARLGGDEFAVLLKKTDANGAIRAAGKIIEGLKVPFSLEGLTLDISASIGIALFPGHGEDADTLIRRAEIAMHTSKNIESDFLLYASQYDKYSPIRLALMGELRRAIEQDQLFLHYQPKIDLKTGNMTDVEALVRWQHPKSGIIPPKEFISLAEHTGLIKELTFWILKEALRQSRGWHSMDLDISVAVNLSVKSLQTPQLLDQIKGLLSTWGVESRSLRFEITESTIMVDPERAMEIITELTVMGIRFSIDDFGTGFSSLGYLQKLPVDEIKIDKSFVIGMITDDNSMKIVRSIIDLSHNLGLKVVAEGVENQETMDRLHSLNCDLAQGYFISKPIPHTELTGWLSR